ncbi:hypothetical protein EBZ35_05640 [bacterium]|nr:hypothetical protein [bacterium]
MGNLAIPFYHTHSILCIFFHDGDHHTWFKPAPSLNRHPPRLAINGSQMVYPTLDGIPLASCKILCFAISLMIQYNKIFPFDYVKNMKVEFKP